MVKIPVYISTTATVFLGEVEVNNQDEFFEKAEKLWDSKQYYTPTLCYQCSDVELSEFEIHNEDIDFYFKKGL